MPLTLVPKKEEKSLATQHVGYLKNSSRLYCRPVFAGLKILDGEILETFLKDGKSK